MSHSSKRLLIQRIRILPTLPGMVGKIIAVSESRSGNARNLADILSHDPAISSTILKLVNSAFYGKLRNVSSIQHASVMLGFQMVKTIAIGVSVFEMGKTPDHSLDREQFWLHSIGTAALAQRLAGQVPNGENLDLETVFLSGLLHDIGKVVFDHCFPGQYRQVIRLSAEEQLWIGHAETRVLEMDHCEAGFYLARKWQFPQSVVEVIRYHHHPLLASQKNRLLCALVGAADYACRRMKLGSGGDDGLPPLDPNLEGVHGIQPHLIEQAMTEIEARRQSLESFVGV